MILASLLGNCQLEVGCEDGLYIFIDVIGNRYIFMRYDERRLFKPRPLICRVNNARLQCFQYLLAEVGAYECHDTLHSCPDIGILLTSRQMYDEASTVF